MFVAIRDLLFARGRFALIASVVALITLLVGFLTGLTGGLANQNVSAMLSLKPGAVAYAAGTGAEPTFADSRLDAATVAELDGVPLGISQARLTAGDRSGGVAVFGIGAGGAHAAPADGTLDLPKTLAGDLGVSAGDGVELFGHPFTVANVVPDEWYSHTPVAWLSLGDWQQVQAGTGQGEVAATAVLLERAPAHAPDGVVVKGALTSLTAIPAFKSEIGSLGLMIVLLFGISALVVGAFFTVWTLQRKGDVAVLKALGASTKALMRDAVGQALLVLLIGVGGGTLIVLAAGLALSGTALPFLLHPLTLLGPALAMTLLGLLGAAASLRTVTTTDPLTALGASR